MWTAPRSLWCNQLLKIKSFVVDWQVQIYSSACFAVLYVGNTMVQKLINLL